MSSSRLFWIAVAAELSLLWLTALDGWGYPPASLPVGLFGLALPSFLPFLFALYRLQRGQEISLGALLLVAVAARLPFYGLGPVLSDDLFRYVWDGQVQHAGINPYTFAPDSPALFAFRDEGWSAINHPELRTPYPPVAQLLFFLGAGLSAHGWGVKVVLGAVELAGIYGLARLFQRRGASVGMVAAYAWNPLPVLEFAWSGHIDAAGIGLFGLALYGLLAPGLSRRARYAGGFAFGAAVLVKYLPLLALPVLWRRGGGEARHGLWAAPLVLVIAAPYYLGAGESSAGSLGVYARRWVFNDSAHAVFYKATREALEYTIDAPAWAPLRAARRVLDPQPYDGPTTEGIGPRLSSAVQAKIGDRTRFARFQMASYVSRGVSLLLLLGFVWRSVRRDDPLEGAALVFGGFLLLAPTVHPWYLGWGLLLAPRARGGAMLAFSALVLLSYQSLANGWVQDNTLRWLEYGAVGLLLAVTWWRERRAAREGGPTKPAPAG